jgi:hypothetical protein
METLTAAALSKDASFLDVEGVPVSFDEPLSGIACAAWDVSPPRPFNPDSALRNGAPVSPEEFVLLVEDARAEQKKVPAPINIASVTKNPLINIWVVILKAIAYIWLSVATLVNLVGYYGVWMKDGFSAVQELLSPFNVVNWLLTILILAPGLVALAWANKLKE